MICFGAKTDQKVKENRTYGSHFKKNKNHKGAEDGKREREFLFIYFILFSLASLFDIRKSDRQNLSGQETKCSTK